MSFRKRGLKRRRQAAIKHMPGSIIVQIMSSADAIVPSEIASLAEKFLKRMMDDTSPLLGCLVRKLREYLIERRRQSVLTNFLLRM